MAPKKPRTRASSTRRGAPSKCTPERIEAIEKAIGSGVGRRAVAQQVGIGVATLCEWMARGRAGEEPYAEMVRRLEGASDDFHDECRSVALAGLRGDDQHIANKTALWFLERLWPDRYGRRAEVTGPKGGPVQIAATVAPAFSDEQLRTLAATPGALEAAIRGFLTPG